jgi:hypothetical protein
MIGLDVAFWVFVFFFGFIGAMRGWAKELLVAFSIILSLFILTVLRENVPPARPFFAERSVVSFWMNTVILLFLSFFGYQTPNIPKIAGSKFAREKLQDVLFGFVLGAFNGYLLVGSIWFFLDQAGYPFSSITPPTTATASGQAGLELIQRLPPEWLVAPAIYFAVAVAFAFVVIVFI